MEVLLRWMERAGAISSARRLSIIQGNSAIYSLYEAGGCQAVSQRPTASAASAAADGAAANSETPERFMDDMRSGIALAKLATVMDKNARPENILKRPSQQWQRDQNRTLFFKACKSAGVSASFTGEDLEMGSNLQGVVKTLYAVSKKLDENKKVKPGIQGADKDKLKAFLKSATDSDLYPSVSPVAPGAAPAAQSRNAASKIYAQGYDILRTIDSGGGDDGDGACLLGDDASGEYYYCENIATEVSSPKLTQLENNIAELFGNEGRYVQKLALLPAIVENYDDHTSLVFTLLRDMTGIMQEALKVHEELRTALEAAPKEDIPLVMKAFKVKLLIYGPLTDQCTNAWRTLSDQKGEDKINREIEKVRAVIAKNEESHYAYSGSGGGGDNKKQAGLCGGTSSSGLQDLLTCPFRHVLRYRLMLQTMSDSVRKELRKGEVDLQRRPWVPAFARNVGEGLLAMSDLNAFINEYKRDCDILADSRRGLHPDKLVLTPDFRGQDIRRNFGKQMFDTKITQKLLTEKNFKVKYLFAFQEVLLFCGRDNKGGDAGEVFFVEQYLKTEYVRKVKPDESNLSLTILAIDKFTVMEDCSHVLKLPTVKALRELTASFLELTKVKHSPLHSSCPVGRWHIVTAAADADLCRKPLFCALDSCRMLLRGRINLGIRCDSCDRTYHEDCYFEGKSPFSQLSQDGESSEDEDEEEEEVNQINVPLGRSENKLDLRDNPSFPVGTYLIYQGEEEEEGKLHLILAVKALADDGGGNAGSAGNWRLKKYRLDTCGKMVRVKGKTVRGGERIQGRTLADLVENHREDFNLGEGNRLMDNYVDITQKPEAERGEQDAGAHEDEDDDDGQAEDHTEEEEDEEDEGGESCEEAAGGEKVSHANTDDFLRSHLWQPCPANPRSLISDRPVGTFLVTKANKDGDYNIYHVKRAKGVVAHHDTMVSKKCVRCVASAGAKKYFVGSREYDSVGDFVRSLPKTFSVPLLPPPHSDGSSPLLSPTPHPSHFADSASHEGASATLPKTTTKSRNISGKAEKRKESRARPADLSVSPGSTPKLGGEILPLRKLSSNTSGSPTTPATPITPGGKIRRTSALMSPAVTVGATAAPPAVTVDGAAVGGGCSRAGGGGTIPKRRASSGKKPIKRLSNVEAPKAGKAEVKPKKSLEEELGEMSFFVDDMDKDISYKVIEAEPPGTFLLRRNEKGRLRVTLKKSGGDGGGHVLHIRVEPGRPGMKDDAEGFHIGTAWAESVTDLLGLFRSEGEVYHFVRPYEKRKK